jgi:cytochrome P450 family 6
MLISSSFFGDLIALLITASVVVIGFYKWRYQYWRKRNVPYLEPRIPFGNVGGPSSREHISLTVKRLYDEIKSKGWKHGGIYLLLSPTLLVVDLDLLKNIMTKDFQYFTDRGFYHNEKSDPLSAHLFNLNGTKWRNLRTKLTPTFTSGKMRMMFQTLVSCEVGMRKKIEQESERRTPIDIKEVLGCFTTDIIGSCAFGLDCKTFEEENSPFREYGRKFFTRNLTRRVKRLIANNFETFARVLDIVLIPKDISKFFMKIVKDTVEYREQKKVVRNDFMQLLIDMKNKHDDDGTTFTIEEIAAQSFVFFIAGFETSSTTMTFALYELAKHQDMQDRLRKEIREVLAKHQDQVSYDAILEMKYMNQVIDGTTLSFYLIVQLIIFSRRGVEKVPSCGSDSTEVRRRLQDSRY